MAKQRLIIGVLTLALSGIPFAAQAQPTDKVWRIGWLGLDSKMQAAPLAAFRKGLSDLGYVEGKNVAIEYRWGEGRFEQLPALAAELVALHVDVIVTASPPGVRAARGATSTIPIVMVAHEPVRMRFVESFAHPGGNVTGIAFPDTELSTKRLDLFRQAVPHLSRLAIVWNGVEGTDAEGLRAVEEAARAMGLQVKSMEVREPKDFALAIAEAKAWGAQGVVELSSPFITKNRKIFLDLLEANRLPATCEMRLYVVEGCLMTYSPSLPAMFYIEASYVDRILKGARPSDLPIDQPKEFEFLINDRTAKSLGIVIPQSLRMMTTGQVP